MRARTTCWRDRLLLAFGLALLFVLVGCPALHGPKVGGFDPRSPPDAIAAVKVARPTLIRIQGDLWIIGLPLRHGWGRGRRVLLTNRDAKRGIDMKVGVAVVLDDSYATAAPVGIVYEEPGGSFDGTFAEIVLTDQRLRIGRGFGSIASVRSTILVEITLGRNDGVGVGDVYEVRSADGRQSMGRIKVIELEDTRAKAAVINTGPMAVGQEVVYQRKSAEEQVQRVGLKIVVCNFTPKAQDIDVARAGQTFAFDLAKHLRDAASSWRGLDVMQVPQMVENHESARALGRSYQAEIVVWGTATCFRDKGCAQPVYTVVDPARLVKAELSGQEVHFDPLSPGSAMEKGSAKDSTGIVFTLLGSLAYEAQHYGDAAFYLGRVPEGALKGDDHFRTLRDLADSQYYLGRVESALETASKLERDAHGKDRGWEAMGVGNRARILADKGQVNDALKLYREALAVFEVLGDRRSRAVFLGEIARILAAMGQIDNALKIHREALTIFEALGDRRARAMTFGDIAFILMEQGQIDKALRLFREALATFDTLGDRRSHAITLQRIAYTIGDRGYVKEALKLYREEMAVFRELGDRRSSGVTLALIAKILTRKGQLDEALKLFREALVIFEALGDRRWCAITLSGIARILSDRGQGDEALKLYGQVLAAFEALGDRPSHAIAMVDIATIHISHEEIPTALSMLQNAYKIGISLGDARVTASAGEPLARVLLRSGARKDAEVVVVRTAEAFTRLGRIHDADALRAILTIGDAPSPVEIVK